MRRAATRNQPYRKRHGVSVAKIDAARRNNMCRCRIVLDAVVLIMTIVICIGGNG